jgi:hypothetical protein
MDQKHLYHIIGQLLPGFTPVVPLEAYLTEITGDESGPHTKYEMFSGDEEKETLIRKTEVTSEGGKMIKKVTKTWALWANRETAEYVPINFDYYRMIEEKES